MCVFQLHEAFLFISAGFKYHQYNGQCAGLSERFVLLLHVRRAVLSFFLERGFNCSTSVPQVALGYIYISKPAPIVDGVDFLSWVWPRDADSCSDFGAFRDNIFSDFVRLLEGKVGRMISFTQSRSPPLYV